MAYDREIFTNPTKNDTSFLTTEAIIDDPYDVMIDVPWEENPTAYQAYELVDPDDEQSDLKWVAINRLKLMKACASWPHKFGGDAWRFLSMMSYRHIIQNYEPTQAIEIRAREYYGALITQCRNTYGRVNSHSIGRVINNTVPYKPKRLRKLGGVHEHYLLFPRALDAMMGLRIQASLWWNYHQIATGLWRYGEDPKPTWEDMVSEMDGLKHLPAEEIWESFGPVLR